MIPRYCYYSSSELGKIGKFRNGSMGSPTKGPTAIILFRILFWIHGFCYKPLGTSVNVVAYSFLVSALNAHDFIPFFAYWVLFFRIGINYPCNYYISLYRPSPTDSVLVLWHLEPWRPSARAALLCNSKVP